MTTQARATVRNAGWLTVQRGTHVAGALAFAVLVPRLMGPESYGRYALLASMCTWFTLLSSLGLLPLIGRRVPELAAAGDRAGLQWFFSNLLGVRLLSGAVGAGLFAVVGLWWLHDLDPWAVAAVAGTIWVGAAADLFFSLFLGLNQAALWGLGEVLVRWLQLVLIIAGFRLWGIPGACLGLLLTDCALLAVGVRLARPYVSPRRPRLDLGYLAPHLGFALMFFGSSLLSSGVDASGDVLLRLLSGSYVQIGYYRLAYSIYLTIGTALPQLAVAFVPLFTSLRVEGRLDALRAWVERLLRVVAVVGMLVVYATLLLARDLVPWVFGPAYAPVAVIMLPLMLALPVLGVVGLARTLNIALDRPGVELRGAAIRLAAFWVLGVPLVSRWGSLGASLAALGGVTCSAVYVMARTRAVLGYSLRPCWTAVGLGMAFLPLAALHGSPAVDAALFLTCAAGYGALLFTFRVVTTAELAASWSALRGRD